MYWYGNTWKDWFNFLTATLVLEIEFNAELKFVNKTQKIKSLVEPNCSKRSATDGIEINILCRNLPLASVDVAHFGWCTSHFGIRVLDIVIKP